MTKKRRPPKPGGRVPGRLSQDDLTLWESIAKTIKPLPGRSFAFTDKKAAPVAPAQAQEPVHSPGAVSSPTPLKNAEQPQRTELHQGRMPGVDGRTAERLRRGQLTIDARIDLHGMTQADAHRALNAFVTGSYCAGRRVLLVITGKGKRGSDPEAIGETRRIGVIRRALPGWLNGSDLRPLVLAFTRAQPRDGGDGAFYVLLKRIR